MGIERQNKRCRGYRPDLSEYISHFTKEGEFCNKDQDEQLKPFNKLSAFQRLCSILEMKVLKATNMPWTNTKGVCFTECPWGSLLEHTKNYSSFGIGFTKEFIYRNNGSPVFYIRFKMLNAIKAYIVDNNTKTRILQFLTPYSPSYDTKYAKKKYPRVDYTHEREWRIPTDLCFEYSDIAFVIIEKHEDYDSLPKIFKESFDRSKVIVMNNYRKIEELWSINK